MVPGSADPSSVPATPRKIPHRGGPMNPSVDRIRSRFPWAFVRAEVIWGETTVYVKPEAVHDIVRYLHDDESEQYDYLSDVTAVEYRDRERPIEVVYFLRSLERRADIRIKVELNPADELVVDSVYHLWHGADWLEREVFDMFGITFRGHPDLRRILMWETYAEGYPLRKSFPLRGRFSRAEQVRQALNANPEAHYSMEELSIAEAGGDIPDDMRERLRRGERGVIPEPPNP